MSSIFHRISVRKFEDKPVSREQIMDILRVCGHYSGVPQRRADCA